MTLKKTINGIIFLSLILMPFQDSALVDSPLGFLGMYLTTVPLLIAMCVDYGIKILNNAKINIFLFLSILYCFIVSLIIGFYYFGANIPVEGLKKTFTIPALIVIYFYLVKK